MLFKPVLPVLEYIVLYDYIKEELCINKAKPEIKCNGKCHLAKEMAKASDTENNGQDKKHLSTETNIVFFQEIPENHFGGTFFYYYKSKITSFYNRSYSYLESDSVFRPPIV